MNSTPEIPPTTRPTLTLHQGRARIAHADWLHAVTHLSHDFNLGSPANPNIDFLYADPPFGTGTTQSTPTAAYPDPLSDPHQHTAWLRERLEPTIPLLKPTATIALHLDWRTAHHARILLDELLSPHHFINHLVWSYGLGGSSPKRFARKHDDILIYAIDPNRYHFTPPRVPATSNRMKGQTKKATDVITHIPALNNMAAERTGYPTQKPRALLELLINAFTTPNALVFDPCAGSGTTAAAAIATQRSAATCDTSKDAITITTNRLTTTQPPTNQPPTTQPPPTHPHNDHA